MKHGNQGNIPAEEFRTLKTHVHTLATVHEMLTHSVPEVVVEQRVSAGSLLDKLLPMLCQTTWSEVVEYEVSDASLTPKQCASLALILNDLVTNALKHGKGKCRVRFQADVAEARLEVCDNGPGFPVGFDALAASHVGLELVENPVETDLR